MNIGVSVSLVLMKRQEEFGPARKRLSRVRELLL
jgi:hypothetical protein